MKTKSEILLRPEILALMPLLAAGGEFKSFLTVVHISLSFFWTTELLFSRLGYFLPKQWNVFLMGFWFASAAQLAHDFLGLNPLWIVSAYLLARPDLSSWFEPRQLAASEIFETGIYFYIEGLALVFFIRSCQVFFDLHWAPALLLVLALLSWMFSRWKELELNE